MFYNHLLIGSYGVGCSILSIYNCYCGGLRELQSHIDRCENIDTKHLTNYEDFWYGCKVSFIKKFIDSILWPIQFISWITYNLIKE